MDTRDLKSDDELRAWFREHFLVGTYWYNERGSEFFAETRWVRVVGRTRDGMTVQFLGEEDTNQIHLPGLVVPLAYHSTYTQITEGDWLCALLST